MLKIGINGFGRIGRLALRIAEERPEIEVVAINSRGNAESHAHLAKYDSTYGTRNADVSHDENNIFVNNKKIAVLKYNEPKDIPRKDFGVDIVLDCVGIFRDKKSLQGHIDQGAKKVLLAAPGKNLDATFVMGVNEKNYKPSEHHIISNASCTTNCLAPIAKLLDENFGIKSGIMTTIHAFTNDQNLLDNRHKKDLRRSRAASMSIIPTSTGATKAVGEVLPNLEGKLTGIALRVPTETVSMVDLAIVTEKSTTAQEVNEMFQKNKSIYVDITNKELVSIDYKAMKQSGMIDAKLTQVINGNLVKIYARYDNERGYTERLLDLVKYIS